MINTDFFDSINKFITTLENESPQKIKNLESIVTEYEKSNINLDEAYKKMTFLIQVL